MTRMRTGVLAIGCAALLAGRAAAQETAPTLSGTVSDERGGAIAEAALDVDCQGVRFRTVTAADGTFSQPVRAGSCTVTAAVPAFERASTTVDVPRSGARLDLVLTFGRLVYDVQVTASRGQAEERRTLPQATAVVTREEIDAQAYDLVPQMLHDVPGVLVQQTTSAQGSPTVRGFTGSANAYLVDGVRFNLSTWRGGPSQYLAWIDTSAVDRLEVVRGPGSVQYGSDAMGGTVNVLPSNLAFQADRLKVGGDVAIIGGSADRSTAGEGAVSLQAPRVTLHLGGSRRSVGDLRPGGGIDSRAAVTRYLGIPSTAVNGSRLPNTGYDQNGAFVRGQVRTSASGLLTGFYVHGEQTGASRYDRIDGGNGLYRSGFAPQQLDFGVLRYGHQQIVGFDAVSAALSVNRQADGTFEQTRPTTVLDQQQAVNRAIGVQVDARRRFGARQQTSLGLERYGERVHGAYREQVNPVSGTRTVQRPDIPDGTSYTSLGAFVQHTVDVVPDRVQVRGGLRYARFDFSTQSNAALGVIAESVRTDALTFQIGTVVSVNRHINATFNASRGFRAPNASDLGGIGLSGGGGFSITPSRAAALGGLVGSTGSTDAMSTGEAVPALGPEQLYAFEPGLRLSAGRVSASVTAFDLEFLDAVQRRAIVFPAGIVGTVISGYEVVRQDAAGLAYIGQDIRPVATSVNADHARVYGVEMDGSVRLSSRWSASGNFSMSNGRLLATSEPVRRMSPPFGSGRVRWNGVRGWVERVVSFARPQTRLNSGDLTDARIGAARTRSSIASYFNGTATDLGLVQGGVLLATGETLAQVQNRIMGTASTTYLFTQTDGFVTLGARAGVRLWSRVDVTLIGDNLTDRSYRIHGSGLDAAGRSLTVRMRVRL